MEREEIKEDDIDLELYDGKRRGGKDTIMSHLLVSRLFGRADDGA